MSKCRFTQPHAAHLTLRGREAVRCPGVPYEPAAPIDWPARFDRAGDAAYRQHRPGIAQELRMFAEVLELQPPDVVEDICRALLGELP